MTCKLRLEEACDVLQRAAEAILAESRGRPLGICSQKLSEEKIALFRNASIAFDEVSRRSTRPGPCMERYGFYQRGGSDSCRTNVSISELKLAVHVIFKFLSGPV